MNKDGQDDPIGAEETAGHQFKRPIKQGMNHIYHKLHEYMHFVTGNFINSIGRQIVKPPITDESLSILYGE